MEQEEAQRLVEAHALGVYRLANARTGSRADAEDITQETFLRLVAAAPAFRDESHCRAWLLRVALNCAADLHRSAWRKRRADLEEADGMALPPPGEEGEDGVLEAVLALPEAYRAPVHLFYYEEMSVAEIAQALGKREGTIRTRLSRARVMLRDILTQREGEAHV